MTWETFLTELVDKEKDGLQDVIVRDDGLVAAYVKNRLIILPSVDEIAPFEGLLALLYGEARAKEQIGMNALEPAVRIGEMRFRVSDFKAHPGAREIVLRYIRTRFFTAKELLLPPQLVDQYLQLRSGLVLMVGEMGSGKSTVMTTLIRSYAQKYADHIAMIEDPVEAVHPVHDPEGPGSVITQREVGVDCASFADGLKEARRQRAKVIVLGEIRDPESAEQCLRAAMMGTLVMATIHGTDASEGVRSFLQELPPGRQLWGQQALATSLKIVLAMRLLRNEDTDSIHPVHELMFNLRDAVHNDTPIRTHILRGDFEKISQAIDGARQNGNYMLSFADSINKRVDERRLPRSMRID